jgi:hypothetical protein
MMILKVFRVIAERFIVVLSMALLWELGLQVGFHGGQGLNFEILPEQTTLLQILYVVIEFLVSIKFLIMLSRQVFPDGIKELVSGQMTIANMARYFPGFFALGIFAGLACHAVVVFVVLIIH